MSFKILDFYKISSPLAGGETDSEDSSRFKRIRWATFLSATTGYGIYYVCRLSMNVVRKPIVDWGDSVFELPGNGADVSDCGNVGRGCGR